MQLVRNHSRLGLASVFGFWTGALLLCVGVPLFLMTLREIMNLHAKHPNEGLLTFLACSFAVIAGLLSSIASLIVGSFVWTRRPGTVLYGFGLIAALVAMYVVVLVAFGSGWL